MCFGPSSGWAGPPSAPISNSPAGTSIQSLGVSSEAWVLASSASILARSEWACGASLSHFMMVAFAAGSWSSVSQTPLSRINVSSLGNSFIASMTSVRPFLYCPCCTRFAASTVRSCADNSGIAWYSSASASGAVESAVPATINMNTQYRPLLPCRMRPPCPVPFRRSAPGTICSVDRIL